jgi:folate-binding protein YgfZ
VAFDFDLNPAELRALGEGHHALAADVAVFRLDGPGTISCLQGMLTNDVAKMAPDGLIWGAFLTPKGMIITDAWVGRDGDAAWVIIPAAAGEAVRTLFARTIPPRLAKVREVTTEMTVRWLVGADAALPTNVSVAVPSGPAPFRGLVMAELPASGVDELLREAGWLHAPDEWRAAARVLAGWPALGREIDEKTLPQEVAFDELAGVRYDKGCYTGQETVARLHFRGHANRLLRGLLWESGVVPSGVEIIHGERTVGTIRTIGQLGARVAALAPIRREVEVGTMVIAGGAEAVVIALPEWGDTLRAG